MCPQTEQVLYRDYSPTHIRYLPGSRPELERIVAELPTGSQRERVIAAMSWVWRNVQHPHTCGLMAPDRGHSAEQLIASQRGWCNEQAHVFVDCAKSWRFRRGFVFCPMRICDTVIQLQKCSLKTAGRFSIRLLISR